MIPHISLAWWLVVALAIIIVWIFEASFRVTANRDVQISELLAAKTAVKPLTGIPQITGNVPSAYH